MKSIIRNFLFVLKRFKTSSILNIIGLSAAFAVFSVTLIQVNYDLGYDRQFKNADNIYFFSISTSDGRGETMPTTMGRDMAEKFPEVKDYCLINNYTPTELLVDIKNERGIKQKFKTRVLPATAGFIKVFTPEIIAGSTKGLFDQAGKALITESEAQKLFGNANPIGKTIYYHLNQKFYNNQTTDFVTVQAVCKDFPKNSSVKNGIYTLLPDDDPSNYNYNGYFVVDKQNVAKLVAELNSEKFFGKESWEEIQKSPERKYTIDMIPLHDAYFVFEKGRLTTTLSFLAIGIITLIIAYINFLNFSIAISPVRVKALNIHKIIGADTLKLKLTLASEAAIFSLLAFVISLVLMTFMKDSFIGEFFSADMGLKDNWILLCVIGLSTIILGMIFGWYPARYVVSFQPAVALSGSFAMSKRSVRLRNILITIQFIAAITLIIVALFIQLQNSYMQKQSWGIQKDNIAYVPCAQLKIDMHTFGEELKKDPRILDYTAAQFIPGHVGMSWGRQFEGKQVSATVWPVQPNFLNFFGVKILQGRDFLPSDSVGVNGAIIFNETFLKKYQFDNNILGKDYPGFTGALTVAGIAKNINYSSLKDTINPMAFTVLGKDYKYYMNWFFIKISGNDIPGAIQTIQKTWEKYSDEDFDLKFMDQTIQKLYENETNLGKLISLFGLVTILISIMGVYGLVVFNTRYKSKEIAIRKVNGASIPDIMFMLNRNILSLLGIAFLIGVPLAYYIVRNWLQQYAYKTPMYWWIFALAGLIVLVVTVIAVSMQSYRAATTNPAEATKRD